MSSPSDSSRAPSVQPWAIVRLRLDEPPRELPELAAATFALDELGALLAMLEPVSGVETKDPAKGGDTDKPELWVYTTPEGVDVVRARTETLAPAMELELSIHPQVRTDDDWRDNWKRFYRPMIFGDGTLLLRPSWIERREGDPRAELVIDPGRAFGTGLHATTQLCLERICLEASRGAFRPRTVLDLGCGSGILALACARLFEPERLVAIDIDPEAAETCRENAALNDLQGAMDIRAGTLDDVPSGPYDLVLANIRPNALVPIASALRNCVGPNARVVLSGILDEESPNVLQVYEQAGWVLDSTEGSGLRRQGIWVAIDLRPGTA